MNRADRKRWQAATSLLDLGELTAQWLEGRIASQPAYEPNCGPDPETERLIPVLAKLNRAGYVTSCSQPGIPPTQGWNGKLWQQRAAVDGFADGPMMLDIEDAARAAGLVVITHLTPGRGPLGWLTGKVLAGDDRTVVTASTDGEGHTWFGGLLSRSNVTYLYDDAVSRKGLRALLDAWQVTVLDPVWGRDDVLWPALESVCGSAVSR